MGREASPPPLCVSSRALRRDFREFSGCAAKTDRIGRPWNRDRGGTRYLATPRKMASVPGRGLISRHQERGDCDDERRKVARDKRGSFDGKGGSLVLFSEVAVV
jgi:hypothetical protein